MSSDPRKGFFSGLGDNRQPEKFRSKKEATQAYFEPQYDPLEDLDEEGRSAVMAAKIKDKERVMNEQFSRMGIFPNIIRKLKTGYYGSKR